MQHDYTDEEIKTAWRDSLSLRAFLAALPERPQAAEIAKLKAEREKWEADALRYCKNADFWRSEHDKAQAVAAVVLAQAVRRMEAVPVEELHRIWRSETSAGHRDLKAVRARLIAAVKDEGQAVVVNEPPKSEKQDPYARLKAYAKAGARIRTHDTEWTNDVDWSWCLRPEHYEVHPNDLHMVPEYAPQAKPLPIATLARDQIDMTPAMAEAAEAVLNEELKAQPWTPAVGDVVRLKSGGPVMTVTHVDPLSLMCAWMNASNELQVEPITTLCLTPAQP